MTQASATSSSVSPGGIHCLSSLVVYTNLEKKMLVFLDSDQRRTPTPNAKPMDDSTWLL